jgi:type II secretory pathway pseudopilin PulG
MRSTGVHRSRRGVLTIETLVAVMILAVVSAMAADAISNYYRTRDQYLWRQAAAWAAAGQLQRYQAGAPIDSTPPENLWQPEIRLQTTVAPGEGDWQGFSRVTVTATVDRPRKQTICERFSGYVRLEGKP